MSIAVTANEINKEAFEVLFRELGINRTIRFINQYSIGRGNYIEMKDKIFFMEWPWKILFLKYNLVLIKTINKSFDLFFSFRLSVTWLM